MPLPTYGLAAKVAAANKAKEEEIKNKLALNPKQDNSERIKELPHRLGVIFDDSGSMCGPKIIDAHEGIEEFLKCCEKNTTAVTVYPLNASPILLSDKMAAIALLVKRIPAAGGTPFIETLLQMLKDYPLTRAIGFSDGEFLMDNEELSQIVAHNIPVDTVYISDYGDDSENLQKIAKATDGIYLKFQRGKTTFKQAFKYLSPGLRHMLMDDNFKNKIQGK